MAAVSAAFLLVRVLSLIPGDQVLLTGLTDAPQYNSVPGTIISHMDENGRYQVSVSHSYASNEFVNNSSENIEPLILLARRQNLHLVRAQLFDDSVASAAENSAPSSGSFLVPYDSHEWQGNESEAQKLIGMFQELAYNGVKSSRLFVLWIEVLTVAATRWPSEEYSVRIGRVIQLGLMLFPDDIELLVAKINLVNTSDIENIETGLEFLSRLCQRFEQEPVLLNQHQDACVFTFTRTAEIYAELGRYSEALDILRRGAAVLQPKQGLVTAEFMKVFALQYQLIETKMLST